MKNKPRCVIIGGASIKKPDIIKAYLKHDDFIIFCDSGLFHAEALDISPDLIIGDFDSHPMPDSSVETIVLPKEKDDTDTVYAAKEALSRGFDNFLLIGVSGDRLDHTLANVSILLMLHQKGASAILCDDFSEMEIVGTAPKAISPKFPFFSLVTIDGPAHGVTITNAKYPLENATINPNYQYAVSNEPLPNLTSYVSVSDGRLLLIRIR